MELLNDSSPMPFGKHIGTDMEDVPASYLMFLWDKHQHTFENNGKLNRPTTQVMTYIKDNLDALKLELK